MKRHLYSMSTANSDSYIVKNLSLSKGSLQESEQADCNIHVSLFKWGQFSQNRLFQGYSRLELSVNTLLFSENAKQQTVKQEGELKISWEWKRPHSVFFFCMFLLCLSFSEQNNRGTVLLLQPIVWYVMDE